LRPGHLAAVGHGQPDVGLDPVGEVVDGVALDDGEGRRAVHLRQAVEGDGPRLDVVERPLEPVGGVEALEVEGQSPRPVLPWSACWTASAV
jgi:hypothetical protein